MRNARAVPKKIADASDGKNILCRFYSAEGKLNKSVE